MPLIRNVIAGAGTLASAKVARQWDITVAAGAVWGLRETALQVNTLPACTWYFLMTAGPAGCTVELQFAASNFVLAGNIRPDFRNLVPPQPLFLNVPVVISQRVAANMMSSILAVPGGGPNATFVVILTASI